MEIERRYVTATISLRSAPAGSPSPGILYGYAAKYNSWSNDLGGFKEQIKLGAFDRALREKQDIRFLMNHDPNVVLGRWKSGTLGLKTDSTGLYFTCELPDTQAGRDLHTLVARGDVSQCSFAFKVAPSGDSWDRSRTQRTLIDVDLFDVSAVTYPAYEDTNISARSRRPDYGAIAVASPTTDPQVLAIRARAMAWKYRIEAEEAQEDADIRRRANDLGRRIAAEDSAFATRNDSADVARMVRELERGK
jgi:uncharacterized protein